MTLSLEFSGEIGCLLPWKVGNRTGRPCETKEDFENFAQVHAKLNVDDESVIIEMTGCLPQCTRFSYAKELLYQPPGGEGGEDFVIGLTFSTGNYDSVRQIPTLPLSTLVGNVGGYLGLLLGYSALDALRGLWRVGAMIRARISNSS